MKFLKIQRGTLELAMVPLNRASVTVGRSPSCDFVLRAPGVAPVHFLLEWIGEGTFDAEAAGTSTDWSIFDVSIDSSDAAGVLLSGIQRELGGFKVVLIDDKLAPAPTLGGRIAESVAAAPTEPGGKDLIEVLQMRSDSGAVEQVIHLQPRTSKRLRPLDKTPEFQILLTQETEGSLARILLDEMQNAKVRRIGGFQDPQSTTPESAAPIQLTQRDLIHVNWQGRDFYIRTVRRIQAPKVPREIFDKLLLQVSGAVISLMLLIGLITWILPKRDPNADLPPPREARIEIQQAAPPTQAPAAPQEVAKAPEPKAAAAPESKPQEKPSAPTPPGKSLAKATGVNTIGVLSALKRNAPAGSGVSLDKVVGEAVNTDALTGKSAPSVAIPNPPSGVLGRGTGGAKGTGVDLAAASSAVRGAGKYNPASKGIQGTSSGISSAGIGSGSGGGFSGDLGNGEDGFQMEGGLDRETVRRVVAQSRSKIRACYERAMISGGKIAGRIVYDWEISGQGPVVSASMLRTTANSPQLQDCVLRVIRAMVFPKASSGRNTRVRYPFVFQGLN